MCGRATLSTPPEVLAELFRLDEEPELEPRFNIAPSQTLAIVRADPHRPGRRIEMATWGLEVERPPTDASRGRTARIVNVRVESMFGRATFRDSARARRCLVIVDGFYEWRGGAAHARQPFHVRRRDARPFALGGLWEGMAGSTPTTILTCAILTTDATPPVLELHDRMPLVVPPGSYDAWLDAPLRSKEEALALTRTDGEDAESGLVAVPVSAFVNSPAHEGPRCLAPPVQTELL